MAVLIDRYNPSFREQRGDKRVFVSDAASDADPKLKGGENSSWFINFLKHKCSFSAAGSC